MGLSDFSGLSDRGDLFQELLRAVRGPSLDVLVIEDLHWADEATIDLVRFLARRLRNLAVLLIVTYRDDGLAPGHPLRVAVGELGTLRSTRRVGLSPLTPAAVRSLAGDAAPDGLYELTGGNPFFVTEVLRAGLTGEVPATARDAVLARAAGLSGEARGVLETAALAGGRIDPRLLDAAVDEVVTAGLLVGDGPSLRFRHELTRLAVEQSIPAHRTGRIHASILAGLRA